MSELEFVEERVVTTIGAIPTRALHFSAYAIWYDNGAAVAYPTTLNKASAPKTNTVCKGFTGQELLTSLCKLADVINGDGHSQQNQYIVDWCVQYLHPYDYAQIAARLNMRTLTLRYHEEHVDSAAVPTNECLTEECDPMEELLSQNASSDIEERLEWLDDCCCDAASFRIDDFVRDMNIVVNAARIYNALCAHYFKGNDVPAAELYTSSKEHGENVPAFGFGETPGFGERAFYDLIGLFPTLPFLIRYSEKQQTIQLQPRQDSVFDICWNTLADLVVSAFGHKPYRQSATTMKCPVCGAFFVRKHNAQKYCGSKECNIIRNRGKAKKHYDSQRKR